MPKVSITIPGKAIPLAWHFDRDGQTIRSLLIEVRDNDNHPLRILYEIRHHIDWTIFYHNSKGSNLDDAVIRDGDKLVFAPRTTGSSDGGRDIFAREMTLRIHQDLASPFNTDEERNLYANRDEESVWLAFWDEHEGKPPCHILLSAVKPKDDTAA